MNNFNVKVLFSCLLLFCNTWILGQSISLSGVSMMSQIVEHENNIIVAGTATAKGKFGSTSKIYFLDENLEQLWSYQLDDYRSNLIGEIAVFDNKIFITGMEGNLGNTWKDTRRFMLVLDLEGNLIKKQQLGICQYLQSTPLVEVDNEVLIYYNTDTTVMRNPYGEYLSFNLSRISLDDLAIEDGPVSFKQQFRTGQPCEIVKLNDKSYLLGLTSIRNDDYCFIKSTNRDTQETERLISVDLLTNFNLQVGEGNQTKILYDVFDYVNGWQGFFITPENILSTDSLSMSNPSIQFDLQPNDIYTHKEHIFFIETIDPYKKYGLAIADLSGKILSRESLDIRAEKLVVNDKYFYFLETFSGAKVIRKRREN